MLSQNKITQLEVFFNVTLLEYFSQLKIILLSFRLGKFKSGDNFRDQLR
jgi:hypothetical protein